MSDASIPEVIEANGGEFLMEIGRAAGGEVRDDGRVRWAIGNSPIDFFNCVALFFAAGVAGVYCVSTVDHARRRGIGAAVTLAALRGARDLGYGLAVLTSSEMGYSVYRKLGFVEYCRIGLYEWRPR